MTIDNATGGRSLDGRTGIVTGAGNALARAGARLVLNDLDDAAASAVADEIAAAGGQAVVCPGDIGEWATGESLLAAALDSFGALDIFGQQRRRAPRPDDLL